VYFCLFVVTGELSPILSLMIHMSMYKNISIDVHVCVDIKEYIYTSAYVHAHLWIYFYT
jgi:hypothetical protein